MADQPLVSVHVITYNHRPFLAETLRSALEQDYDRLEVVVADDDSTDGARDIIADFAARYPDRLVAITDGHVGINENYNRALRRCTGKYVAILNGDDLFLPGKVAAQVEWLEQAPNRVFCAHDVEHFDSDTGRALRLHSEVAPMVAGVGPRHFIEFGCPFVACSVMVRRSALPPQGVSPRVHVSLDWKFNIDALVGGGEFGFIDGVYSRYRIHSNSVTFTRSDEMWRDGFTTLALLEADYPEFAHATQRGRARRFYRFGIEALKAGDASGAKTLFRAAALASPSHHLKLPAWYLLATLPRPVRQFVLDRRARR